MRRVSIIAVLIYSASLVFAINASATPGTLSPVTIDRLAGLAKLWGAIKYFHPYLADRDIDWDAALVQTIPKVESSNSTEDYRQAVDFMLSFLHDPNTHTLKEPSAEKRDAVPSPGTAPEVKWMDDQTAFIDITDHDYFAGSFEKAQAFAKVFEEARKAKTIIFDIRDKVQHENTDEDSSFWYANGFRGSFPSLLDHDLVTSSQRTRTYSGYPTQQGGYSGYYSAFVTQDGQTLHGSAPSGQTHKMIFIINAGTNGFLRNPWGLQSAGLATIVQEGEAESEGGAAASVYDLPEDVKVIMRTGEVVNPDGSIGFHADINVPESPDFSGPRNQAIRAALEAAKQPVVTSSAKPPPVSSLAASRLENPYPEMAYPSAEYRLLSLFRFWNVMFYFHAYRQLYDHPWDESLTDFIPQFEADQNQLEYAITTAKLVARINDSHGSMRSQVLRDYIGTGSPAAGVRLVEGQTVVSRIWDDSVRKSSGLAIGDVVLSVDGEEIGARRNRLGELFAASTSQALNLRVSSVVLAGPKEKPAQLKIKAADGQIKEVSITRDSTVKPPKNENPIFKVLPEGFGYIDLTRLLPAQLNEAFEAIKNTPGLIFDMRGYPNGVFAMLGARFAEKKVATAVFETPTPDSPDPTEISRARFIQYAEPDSNWKYKGKVVVLINEQAISQAEHTCLFLEVTAHPKFIGSATEGANGDVTQTVLPGNIPVYFSGHDVRHADGRQLQRVGIQPDIKVEPTIQGIRDGRDELLERAVRYLKDGQ